MTQILSTHSVFFWLHLYRRIGVRLSPDHDNKTDANTLALVREIVDLSIFKHGDLKIIDDVRQASDVHFKDILGGHYKRLWTKWLGEFEARKKFRALTKTKQWVITSFKIHDLINMYKLEGLAYEYWHVTATMRAIGKGSTVRWGAGNWPERGGSATFERLIRSYDDRISNMPLSTSLLGSWYHADSSTRGQKGRILATSYNVQIAIADDVGYLENQDGIERSEQGELFMSVVHLMQRAYTVIAYRNTLADDFLGLSKDYEGSPFACDRSAVERCLQSLTLSPGGRSQIGLWSGGKRFPLIPHGTVRIVDYEGFSPLLLGLFVGIQYEQGERGSVFEDSFRRALIAEGFDLAFVGEIVAKDGSKREIDASVRIGDELVLLECRSIERPLDFEIGRPRTLQRRQEFLQEKVNQVMTLEDFIRLQPIGRNYDFSWARRLEAFVVSPFVEWIWDYSSRLWYDDRTPRILQADEAIALLHRFNTPSQG